MLAICFREKCQILFPERSPRTHTTSQILLREKRGGNSSQQHLSRCGEAKCVTESLTALEGGGDRRAFSSALLEFVAIRSLLRTPPPPPPRSPPPSPFPYSRAKRNKRKTEKKVGNSKYAKLTVFCPSSSFPSSAVWGKSVCVRLIYVVVSLPPPPPQPRKILDRPDTFSSLSDKRSNTSFPPNPEKKEYFLGSFRSPGALH